MFIAQPSSSFGDQLCEELESIKGHQPQWQTFEFAVAWVNEPGAKRIANSLQHFLSEGGSIHATVGLDFSSTSYEGLSSLLDLEDKGAKITTNVFFDENQACTFHPKVFLFKNQERARLFVGSNNMTSAGLDTNVEVALGFTAAINNETIEMAQEALRKWRDESTEPRTRRLTRSFLQQLLDERYVRTEEQIRSTRNSETAHRPSGRQSLFGKSESKPRIRSTRTPTTEPDKSSTIISNSGNALLMRVRPRRNGRQIQISMKVYIGSFMDSATEVVSATTNVRREIGFNFVTRNGRKKRNTARFEAPELEGIADPVARFRWVNSPNRELQYEIFDASDNGEGTKIHRALAHGITTPPVTKLEDLSTEATVLSKSEKESAQWYRMI